MQTENNARCSAVDKTTSCDLCCWEYKGKERENLCWVLCPECNIMMEFWSLIWKKKVVCVWGGPGCSVTVFCDFRSSKWCTCPKSQVFSSVLLPEWLLLFGWTGRYDNTVPIWTLGTKFTPRLPGSIRKHSVEPALNPLLWQGVQFPSKDQVTRVMKFVLCICICDAV
jgi:hypothetical protein